MTERKKNKRIDHWVKERFPNLTGRQIEEAIREGLIRGVNGKRLKKGDRPENDSNICYEELGAHVEKIQRGNAGLVIKILHEDEHMVVIDKPSGIPSHPIGLFDTDTVTHWAIANYPHLGDEFEEIQPTVTPHRLDTGTSGLLIIAKTKSSFEEWRRKFNHNEVEKKYRAWCWGDPELSSFEINWPIAHALSDARKMVAVKERGLFNPPLQEARSTVKVLEKSAQGMFLCEVTSSSGVTHQIRVHLAAHDFPLVGDSLYDPFFESRPVKPKFHQLRAVEIQNGMFRLSANVENFVPGAEVR